MEQNIIYNYTISFCKKAGESDTSCQAFWDALTGNQDVYEEWVYYLEHQDFMCKTKIEELTIVDILVWQMDHFKAALDQEISKRKHNPTQLVFAAFQMMLLMKKEPEKYLPLFRTDTGTDYPGKF